MTLQTRITKSHPRAGLPPFCLHVDAQFENGVTAIFGPSGSGKSTWLECIAGLQSPDSGQIVLNGETLFTEAKTNVAPSHRGIGYIFQNAALFPHMTARENVEYGLHPLPTDARRRLARESMESFHIEQLTETRAGAISGGERQRVALARALVRKPRCLLLDEPFSALDYSTKEKIMDDVLRWNRTHSVPVLLVTHALEEVLAMADRVLVLMQGCIVSEGTPAQVLSGQRDQLVSRLTAPARDLLS